MLCKESNQTPASYFRAMSQMDSGLVDPASEPKAPCTDTYKYTEINEQHPPGRGRLVMGQDMASDALASTGHAISSLTCQLVGAL